jgi:hypothetical protein
MVRGSNPCRGTDLVGRDSSDGIATPYGLNGPGSNPGERRDFPHPSRPALRPTQPPIRTMGTGSFPGLKRLWRGADHPPEVKERVELYVFSPSGPSWPVLGYILLYFYVDKQFFSFCGYNDLTARLVMGVYLSLMNCTGYDKLPFHQPYTFSML